MLELLVEMSEGNAALVRRMVADVGEERMCWQPANLPNHPAWQVGHLTFVRAVVARVLGRPGDIEEGWLKRFERGSAPTGDAGAYPSKGELLEKLGQAQGHLSRVLRGADWEAMGGPHGIESLRHVLPTTRHLVVNFLTTHDGMHMGQLMDWRRAAGLPGVL